MQVCRGGTQPSGILVNYPPGHLWREKWTAVSGPLSIWSLFGDKAMRPTAGEAEKRHGRGSGFTVWLRGKGGRGEVNPRI